MGNQNRYEISPRSTGGFERTMGGRHGCAAAAEIFLQENPSEQAVGCYHSHPSPGPVRRFIGEARRQEDGSIKFVRQH